VPPCKERGRSGAPVFCYLRTDQRVAPRAGARVYFGPISRSSDHRRHPGSAVGNRPPSRARPPPQRKHVHRSSRGRGLLPPQARPRPRSAQQLQICTWPRPDQPAARQPTRSRPPRIGAAHQPRLRDWEWAHQRAAGNLRVHQLLPDRAVQPRPCRCSRVVSLRPSGPRVPRRLPSVSYSSRMQRSRSSLR